MAKTLWENHLTNLNEARKKPGTKVQAPSVLKKAEQKKEADKKPNPTSNNTNAKKKVSAPVPANKQATNSQAGVNIVKNIMAQTLSRPLANQPTISAKTSKNFRELAPTFEQMRKTPMEDRVDPEFARKHPTATKALTSISKGIEKTLLLPLRSKTVDRIVSSASNAMTMGTNSDLADTRNKGLNVVADIVGNAAGYATKGPMTPTMSLNKFSNKVTAPVINKALSKAPQIVKVAAQGGSENALLGVANGVINNQSLEDTLKGAGKDFLGGALFGVAPSAIGKGAKLLKDKAVITSEINVGREKPKTTSNSPKSSKVQEPVIVKSTTAPKPDIKPPVVNKTGKPFIPKSSYQIKNTQLEKATAKLDDAMETIRNKYGHYQLTPDEVKNISKDTGIDLDSLVSNFEKAQKFDMRKPGNQGKYGVVAGVVEAPKLKKPDFNRVTPPKPRTRAASPIQEPKLKTSPGKPVSENFKTIKLQKSASDMSLDELNQVRSHLINKKNAYSSASPNEVRMGSASMIDNDIKIVNDIIDQRAQTKNRQFAENSALNSEIIPDEVKAKIEADMPKYEVQTNEEQLNRAWDDIKNGTAQNKWEAIKSEGLKTGDNTALGQALIMDAINKGDHAAATKYTIELAEKLTDAGRAVQAASILKRTTPEGMLQYAQRVLARVSQKTGKGIELDAATSKKITEQMKKVNEMPDGRAKDIEFAKVGKIIEEQIPSTFGEKVKTVRIISMLFNPKTHVRNIVGNTLMGGLENISQAIAAGLDKGLSLATKKRTTLLPNLGTQLKGFGKGIAEQAQDIRHGVDTSPSATQYDIKNGPVFKSKVGRFFEKASEAALKFGDRPFYQAAYNDALRAEIKLAGVEKPTQEIIDRAREAAARKTYQDVNYITNMFTGMRDGLNAKTNKFGLGDVILPFAKTPANILKRALEYNPVGVVETMVKSFKGGKFNQKEFVNGISRNLVGSAILMLGYDLAQKGIITGRGERDKDLNALNRQAGISNYAINTGAAKRFANGEDAALQKGDTFVTYDWAQPASMVLAVGADIFLGGKDRKEAENVAWNAVKSGGTTFFNQSVVKGLQSFMGGYSPMDSIANTLQRFPSSFAPTAGKQIAQYMDGTQRSTYDPSYTKEMINMIKVKVPWLKESLQPAIDTLGREQKEFQGKNNVWNVFFNPSYTTTYNPTEAENLLKTLVEDTGEKGQLPIVVPEEVTISKTLREGMKTDLNKVQLSPEERKMLQQWVGQTTAMEYERLANTPEFQNEPSKKKIEIMNKMLADIKEAGYIRLINTKESEDRTGKKLDEPYKPKTKENKPVKKEIVPTWERSDKVSVPKAKTGTEAEQLMDELWIDSPGASKKSKGVVPTWERKGTSKSRGVVTPWEREGYSNSSSSKPISGTVGQIVEQTASRYGIPSALAHALVKQESGGNPNARSPVGAMGVMQLMPATAKGLGVKDPWDPAQNIDGGMRYLSQLIKQYDGRIDLALAAYNGGPGRLKQRGYDISKMPAETQNYVRKIMSNM